MTEPLDTKAFFWHVECTNHPASAPWIVCIHESEIAGARLVEGQEPIVGEAVCPSCRVELDSNCPSAKNYRFACGSCVRQRWPVENAS